MIRKAPGLALLLAILALGVAPVSGANAGPVPVPVVRKLDNGLTVAVFPDHRLPVVQIQILVPAGSVHEPSGETGVANLTAQMLSQGTSSRTPEDFAMAVQRLGGSIGGAATRDFTTVNGAFLAADLEAGLELLADAVVNPNFSEDRFLEVKNQMVNSLLRARQNPTTVADELLWAGVFPTHPYGRPPLGSMRTLPAMSISQVRAFHRQHYRPDRALLAIAGDVTPEHAFSVVWNVLGRWGGRAAEPPAMALPTPASGWRVRIVDIPGYPRAELRAGTLGPARGAADRTAFEIASEMLDDATSAAGLGIRLLPLQDAGLFSVATSVPADSAGVAAARMRAALERWSSERPSETALAAVRRRMLSSYPLTLETRGNWIAQWMGAALAGRPDSALAAYADRLGSVHVADVHSAIQHWNGPAGWLLIAVGPADKLRPQLEALGPVEIVAPEAAVEATAVSPSTDQTPPTAAQLDRGRKLADLAIAAHGGLARLRGIKDSVLEGDIVMSAGPREYRGEILQARKDPMRFVFSTTFKVVKTVQALDGEQGWTQGGEPPVIQDLDSLEIAGLRTGFRSDLHHLLLSAADPSARVAWRGQERLDERDVDVIEVVSVDGARFVLFLDPATHQLLAMDQGEGGHSARRLYTDVRDVNGVLWPFHERRLFDGQPAMTLTLRRVAFNTGISDDTFRRPGTTTAPTKRPRPR